MTPPRIQAFLHRAIRPVRCAVAVATGLAAGVPLFAATPLADAPIFANNPVAGNLALPMSVEYPTAVSVAHGTAAYAPATAYLGYFDPNKCYYFQFVDVETSTSKSHFYPAGAASSHTCTGASNDGKWSGNFLNWAATQTIDPFRWALTGGYRAVDTSSLTLLEKAWHSGQGGTDNYPNRTVTDQTTIANATPFRGTATWTSVIQNEGYNMAFTVDGAGTTGGLMGTYYNSADLSGDPVLTRFEKVDYDWGSGSPLNGVVSSSTFSARWVSHYTVPTTGSYRFQVVAEGGARLWVNGVLVIDRWSNSSTNTFTTTSISMTAGNPLNVRLEYTEQSGDAQIRLRWIPPGTGGGGGDDDDDDDINAASRHDMDIDNECDDDDGDINNEEDDCYNTTGTVYAPNTYMRLPVRVKVCDAAASAGGLESNCKAYSTGYYKPEGLMQKYARRIRYSVFSYLNDSTLTRDGGVLRAKQKFIGPLKPVPGSVDVSNSALEWDSLTGVISINPDAADASATATAYGVTVSNSGVLNYINKFGEISRGNYKSYDPVSELYYAAIRYFRNLGNVSAWSSMSGATTTQKNTYIDGFPVITTWDDPIQYACQKNVILGIGDVNTHADKNVPGSAGSTNEPSKPSSVSGDTDFNAVTSTNKVGVMEGIGGGSLGTVNPYGGCCNNNSTLIAGMAYQANTNDIRPDVVGTAQTIGKQTIQTYWLDVLEYNTYENNNQYYLAAKYGGFTVPSDFDYATRTAALPDAWWTTNGETLGSPVQKRPDNYFVAAHPEQMINGLTAAFADIIAKLPAYTTSFAVAQPQVTTTANASYSALYDAAYWTGDVIASQLDFVGGAMVPTLTEKWRFSAKLAAQVALDSGTGWSTRRKIATWNTATNAGVRFLYASLSPAQQTALDTSYRSGNDGSDYLNYLRGDGTHEQDSTVSSSAKAYRVRTQLVGDIVNSRAKPVGPPAMPLSNAANPGYSTFKTTWSSRKKMIYVGSNDGIMHAIDGALTTGESSTFGQELFAYVPGALYQGPTATPQTNGLAALGNPYYEHKNFVNSTPFVIDIDFGRTPGGSGTNWRSVLVGGLGKGGKSYYALDVTDPGGVTDEASVASRVLWEFTDADMGYTFGEPVVVKTKRWGWTMFLPSGYNNTDGRGYIFVVNPRTGALLQKISTGAGSASVDSGLAQLQGFVLDRTDGYADAIYGGDLLGNVWRLDVRADSGDYLAPTKIATLADAGSGGNAQPITSKPLIEVDPKTRERYVLVGTGRLLESGDMSSTGVQTMYAIKDGTEARFNATANLPAGVTFPITRNNLLANTNLLAGITYTASNQMGWYYDLAASGAGWRVISDPAAFYGMVSFTAMSPTGADVCASASNSRVYATAFGTGKTTLTTTTGGVTSPATYTSETGLVTDLRFLSVSGQAQLLVGTDTGALKNAGNFTSTTTFRRLNWRELPLAE